MGRRWEARRRHTPEFKVEAVQLMRERLAAGMTLQRVSEELEVGPDLLRVWGKQVEAAPEGASPQEIFPGHGGRRRRGVGAQAAKAAGIAARPRSAEEELEEELARLQRENERLRQERDFLKKATAFFAKESR
jgi:transposase-like protein